MNNKTVIKPFTQMAIKRKDIHDETELSKILESIFLGYSFKIEYMDLMHQVACLYDIEIIVNVDYCVNNVTLNGRQTDITNMFSCTHYARNELHYPEKEFDDGNLLYLSLSKKWDTDDLVDDAIYPEYGYYDDIEIENNEIYKDGYYNIEGRIDNMITEIRIEGSFIYE